MICVIVRIMALFILLANLFLCSQIFRCQRNVWRENPVESVWLRMYYILAESVALSECGQYINAVKNARGISRAYDVGTGVTEEQRWRN